MATIKPLLSATIEDVTKLRYPLMVSPKLDGIRILCIPGLGPVTRSLKPIPNHFVRNFLSNWDYEYLDGEVVVGPPSGHGVYNRTVSGIMSQEGEPDFTYQIFDYFEDPTEPFHERYSFLETALTGMDSRLQRVTHYPCEDRWKLEFLEEMFLNQGYEGLMARDPNGIYKSGRSSLKEGILMKLKRFQDAEAIITGFQEKLHNANEAKTNALGYTERASLQENLVPAGTLGSLRVRSPEGVEFNIGSGFDDGLRQEIWNNQDLYLGQTVKYKFQPSGVKDLPRFPIFLGFRKEE